MKTTLFSLSLGALAIASPAAHGPDEDDHAPLPSTKTTQLVSRQEPPRTKAAWEVGPQGQRIIPPLTEAA
jgi:hypothetical protein